MQEDVIAIPRASREEHIAANAAMIQRRKPLTSTSESNEEEFVIATFLDDDDMIKIRNLDGSLGSLWDE